MKNKSKYKKIKGINEHRIVMEKKIKRKLKKKEVVHHINSNRLDNQIHNLMLFPSQKAHASFHSKIIQFGYTQPIRTQIKHRFDFLKNKKS